MRKESFNDSWMYHLGGGSAIEGLDNVNDRMCRDLGLYYDSNYNLVIKKDNSK